MLPRLVARTGSLLDRLLAAPWFSYLLIAALQLKVIWGIWMWRDMTGGDTSGYFRAADLWSQSFFTNPVWSPLYTAFYGTVHWLIGDVYASNILHRAIIVMAATVGVLAVLRRLLPPAFALLTAAWWAILPINFDVLYEVHLFAFLPVLAALLVAGSNLPWRRGIALATLVAAMLLARFELVVGVLVYAVMCLVQEIRELRSDQATSARSWRSRAAAYAVPLTIALGVCAIFVWRSSVPHDQILARMHVRSTWTLCQGYAFTWLQIHPESKLNPWLECPRLMQDVFGQPRPSLGTMIAANPAAVREYLAWNLSLVPNGLQVALFDAMGGTVNPDFSPVRNVGSTTALALGVLALLIAACGVAAIARRWDDWGPDWFRPRKDLWFVMLALLCVSLPVFLVVRPRPSYLYPTTLTLMAMIGTAVHVLLPSRWLPAVNLLAVVGVPALVLTQAPYYRTHPSDRPLYTNYERLRPFAAELSHGPNRMIFGDHYGELVSYLGLGRRPREVFGYAFLSSWQPPERLDRFLDRERINVLFIQPGMMRELRAKPEARTLLEQPELLGWRRLAPPRSEDANWLLLYHDRVPSD